MSTPTPGSPNISALDSKIVADLCAGNFYIDVTPSTWIGTGYNNVQGASVRVTNPVGAVIKQFPTSGFDIYPPMTSAVTVAIPLLANIYSYGTYTISVRLTDANGDYWEITKTVNICPPNPENKNSNFGCLNINIKGNCRAGSVLFYLNNPRNYKGTVFTSQVNLLTVKYPTASGSADVTTALSSFSLILFEGQYQVSGTVCVLYYYGDSVYFKVNYKVKCEKTIKCIIDECCVFARLAELNMQLKRDCLPSEQEATSSIIFDTLRLLKTAELAAECGEDPSDYIDELEKLLGCVCTCNCNDGAPIGGVNSYGVNYIYRALLHQAGTDNPTAIVSSLNAVTISWAYLSDGLYIGTISGLPTDLTPENTFILLGNASAIVSSANAKLFMGAGYQSANSIYVYTNNDGTPANGLLNQSEIELSILG